MAERGSVHQALSDVALDAMLRDGWTPEQVRALIASYRALREELGYVGHGYVKPDKRAEVHRKHCFSVVERELRERDVLEVHMHTAFVALIREGEGRDGEGESMFEAFKGLKGGGMTNRFAKASSYQHPEAFCLMLYQGQTSKRVLDIWNSRDGVTPFIATIEDDEYIHIAFTFDRCVPNHRLRPGDYFWRDMTELEAERVAAMRIDQLSPDLNEQKRAQSIAELAREILRHGGGPQPWLDRAPFIEVVDHG